MKNPAFETPVYIIALIIIIGISLYGEHKCLKEGRPLFYQFCVWVLLLSSLSNAYDTLAVFLFNQIWEGMSLTAIAYLGEEMLFFGAIMEMILFLKSKGTDCSLKTGFGAKTILLACIPLTLEVYSFILNTQYNETWYCILSTLFAFLPTFTAALILFRENDESGFVRLFRLPCCAIMLTNIAGSFIDYTLCIDGPFYLINCCIFVFFAAIMMIGLERGSQKWI